MANRTMLSFLAALLLLSTPAAYGDDNANPPPPNAMSQSTWLFSWTNNPAALSDPAGHVASQLAYADSCVKKISASIHAGQDGPVPGCEGDQMAAGPGIYVCDNPFTSHDYGSTVLVMQTKPGDRNVANMSGLVAQASDGVDRSVTGNVTYDAIFYDFRPEDAGGYALAVREPAILDASQTFAVHVPLGPPKEFHFHEPFACTPQASVKDALGHWGDQLDFLALTFDSFRDPSEKAFEGPGHQLNDYGLMAALSSNIVAVSDSELEAKIKTLSGHSAELKTALGTEPCQEADHGSPRMCLAYELYDSLVGEMGTPNHPSNAWSFPALKVALLGLGIIDASTAHQLGSLDALRHFLATRFMKDPVQLERVGEAFGCMKAVKSQLNPGNLSTWPAPVPSAH